MKRRSAPRWTRPTPTRCRGHTCQTRTQTAAEEALELIGRLSEDDLVLVLVSGSGSALRRGDRQINVVRKHLSRLKGGQLAVATAARILALLLSEGRGLDVPVWSIAAPVCCRDGPDF
ncbi:MAG: DUF4147 domain-containing protein [Solirubrobacteraceae bacterium]